MALLEIVYKCQMISTQGAEKLETGSIYVGPGIKNKTRRYPGLRPAVRNKFKVIGSNTPVTSAWPRPQQDSRRHGNLGRRARVLTERLVKSVLLILPSNVP